MNELRSYRESKGWTQAQMASAINTFLGEKTGKAAKFSKERICDFERGERGIPARVIWFLSDG